jgi:histidinol-phosphate aminotransferase
MSRFWSDLVHRLTPYVPGEQPQGTPLLKLNTNESPYPPSQRVLEVLASIDGDRLRRYPDPDSLALREAIARQEGVRPQEVFLGNGSDEVLAHVFRGLLQHPQPVLFPDVTYSFYPVWCRLYDIDYEQVPVTADLAIDVADYSRPAGGVILANPNSPTGRLLSLDEIRLLLAAHPDTVVVIDEAYIHFGGDSAVALIREYDNLLVVQTMSKSRALAGVRVGVALANEKLIEALQRLKNSFNSYPLDAIAQALALASLEDDDWFRQACQRVIASRARLTAALECMGFEVQPSMANFVLARHPGHRAEALYGALRERGILVRHFNLPRIADYLRISIGTEDECERLLNELSQLV